MWLEDKRDLNTMTDGGVISTCGYKVRKLNCFITPITMLHGIDVSVLIMFYKHTYNWGGGTTLYVYCAQVGLRTPIHGCWLDIIQIYCGLSDNR